MRGIFGKEVLNIVVFIENDNFLRHFNIVRRYFFLGEDGLIIIYWGDIKQSSFKMVVAASVRCQSKLHRNGKLGNMKRETGKWKF